MISNCPKFFAFLILVCVISGCKNFSRLLNQGGTEFTIEIETSEPNKNEIYQQAVKVVSNRINAVGIDGEVTQNPEKNNQISVKIYGSNDLETAKKFLFTTNQLELKKVVSPPSPSPPQTFPSKESAEQSATKDQEVLPYFERDENAPAKFVIVEKIAIVNGLDIRDAQAVPNSTSSGSYQIYFTLNKEGAAKFGDWTGKNINNYLAVVLDKKVQSMAYIKSQIFDQGQIDGRFTKQSAQDIALNLKSGYLPATMKIIDEKPFGK